MTTIVTRAGKGSPLTNTEMDTNLTNLNTDKIEGLASSVDNEIALFSGTGGKTIKRATTTGVLKATSGVIAAATAGTDFVAPGTTTTFTATQNFAASGATLKGSSTGITTFTSANASATNYTCTFPAATTTLPIATQTITWSGPSTARTYTLPDASTTILTTNAAVTVAQGGTGATTLTGVLKGNGTSAFSAATAGTDFAKPDTASSWTAQQTFKELKDTVHTITDAAGFEIDPANGSIQVVTLGASRTPAATNFEAGQTVLLGIDDGSTYSVTWTSVNPTWLKVGGTGAAPTLATSGFTWVLLFKQGTTMFGVPVGSP